MSGLGLGRGWIGGLLAVLTVATAAVAQQAPVAPAATPDIVVHGRPLPDEARIRELARSITPRTGWDEPLARFADPVCFATGGLSRPLLQTIGARMADTTGRAGIRLAGDGCKPNVAVLFVEDGHAQIEELRKRTPWLLGNLDYAQVRAMLKEPGPVHAWSSVETVGRDGDRPFIDPVSGLPNLKVAFASRIALPIRRDMLVSVVLIERKAILGRTLQQVADYAVMRALAMVRPRGASGGDTILTLFDPDATDIPAEMTRFDQEYLKGLYMGQGNRRVADTVSTIVRNINRSAKPRRPTPYEDDGHVIRAT